MYIGSTLSFLFIYLNLFCYQPHSVLLYFSVHFDIDSRGMKISFFPFQRFSKNVSHFFTSCWIWNLFFLFKTIPLDHRESKGIQKNIYFCFMYYVKAFDHVDHNKLWTILKEMRIPDHLICLLRNLHVGLEAKVINRTGHVTNDWFKPGIGVWQGYILTSCLFNLYEEHIREMPG